MLNDREIMIHWISHFKCFFALTFPMTILEDKAFINEIDKYRKHYAISISFDEMMQMVKETGDLLRNDQATIMWKMRKNHCQ